MTPPRPTHDFVSPAAASSATRCSVVVRSSGAAGRRPIRLNSWRARVAHSVAPRFSKSETAAARVPLAARFSFCRRWTCPLASGVRPRSNGISRRACSTSARSRACSSASPSAARRSPRQRAEAARPRALESSSLTLERFKRRPGLVEMPPAQPVPRSPSGRKLRGRGHPVPRPQRRRPAHRGIRVSQKLVLARPDVAALIEPADP
jgi:hypothetical protein